MVRRVLHGASKRMGRRKLKDQKLSMNINGLGGYTIKPERYL